MVVKLQAKDAQIRYGLSEVKDGCPGYYAVVAVDVVATTDEIRN